MEFSLKIGLLSLFFPPPLFFLQGYIEMKMKLRNNRGVLEGFKRKQERKTSKRKERKKRKKNKKMKKENKKRKKKKKEKQIFFPN